MPRQSIERLCEVCGVPFRAFLYKVREGKGRFCSRACADRYQARNKVVRDCLHCGKTFSKKPSLGWRCCSRACEAAHRRRPLADRLASQTAAPDESGCMLWTGSVAPNGYGGIGLGPDGPMIGTHRAAWIVANGPIPPGMAVCHRCDVKRCLAPSHLFLGTLADNNADMMAKGRHVRGVGVPQSKLDDDKVRAIRRLYAAGGISQREVGERYGVTQTTVGSIVRRKKWKHVTG